MRELEIEVGWDGQVFPFWRYQDNGYSRDLKLYLLGIEL